MQKLPVIGPESRVRIEPKALLARRLVKKGNAGIPQILVKWSNLADEDATWEDYSAIQAQIPEFLLGDKSILEGEGVLASAKVELGVTVESLVNLVKNEQKEGWM